VYHDSSELKMTVLETPKSNAKMYILSEGTAWVMITGFEYA
jgi:hypothetical protein